MHHGIATGTVLTSQQAFLSGCVVVISDLSPIMCSYGILREIGMRPDPPHRPPSASNLAHPGLLPRPVSQ